MQSSSSLVIRVTRQFSLPQLPFYDTGESSRVWSTSLGCAYQSGTRGILSWSLTTKRSMGVMTPAHTMHVFAGSKEMTVCLFAWRI